MAISSEKLKAIILANEKFIVEEVKDIVGRDDLVFPARAGKVCVIYGVRRSGKSYILFDIFKQHKDTALYIDFEDERLTDFTAADFETLLDSFFELKPGLIDHRKNVVLLFDEIQNIEGWEKFVRRAVEKEKLRVFVTGSSSKIMPQEIHTALRGRSWGIEVFPFSFFEYNRAKNPNSVVNDLLYGSKKAVFKNNFSHYFQWGGFPEVIFAAGDYEKRKILKEYLDAMFFKDLVERFNVKNIVLLDTLKDKIFSSFSQKHSLTSFCKHYKDKFPFSKDSVFAYYRYFLESMLIFEAQKLSDSSYQRMRNPPKIYLVDTGLARSVTSQDSGRILENLVFLQLRRKNEHIFYFEERQECDFVVNGAGGWAAYQVTWEINQGNREREIAGLVQACRHLNLKSGVVITNDEEGDERNAGVAIKIIPMRKWVCKL